MLTDSVSLGLAWYAFHIASRAATARMTYGFDRIKTLVAYTNGMSHLRASRLDRGRGLPPHQRSVAGARRSHAGHRGPRPGRQHRETFLVLHGGDRESLNMRGAILHVLGDLLGSVAALIAAAVIILTGWMPIDPILSAFVAVISSSAARGRWCVNPAICFSKASRKASIVTASPGHRGECRRCARDPSHACLVEWTARNMATLHACLTEGTDAYAVVTAIKSRLAGKHGIEHATVEPNLAPVRTRRRHIFNRGIKETSWQVG